VSFRVALSSRCRTWLIFEVNDSVTKLHAITERSCRLATSSGVVFGCHQIGTGGSSYGDKDTNHFAYTSSVGTLLHRSLNTSRIDRSTVGSSLTHTTDVSFTHTIIQGVIHQILKICSMLFVRIKDIETFKQFCAYMISHNKRT
jgi:hypothetical protein